MIPPKDIQIIGEQVAILWSDGAESYFTGPRLRAASPSAEARGETDILGHVHGGENKTQFPGVHVTGWERVGNYAIRFEFSDGHRTGLYSYDYLRQIDADQTNGESSS